MCLQIMCTCVHTCAKGVTFAYALLVRPCVRTHRGHKEHLWDIRCMHTHEPRVQEA